MSTAHPKRTSKLTVSVVRSGTGSASLAALANVPDGRKAVTDIFPEACVQFRCRRTGCTTPGLANHIREMSGGRGRTAPSPPRQQPVVIGGTGHD